MFTPPDCGELIRCRAASMLARERLRNVLGYMPMKNINTSRGTSNPISRAFRSESLAFASLVFVPNTTRCNIQSMYTAAQIIPVPAIMVTIQA